jgi:hypothetical protein
VDFRLALEPHDQLIVHLRDGAVETTVEVAPSHAGIDSLSRGLTQGLEHGYGECFSPAPGGGQYWWIFSRRDESLEVAVMWTRGGASLWEHVFRATDNAEWVRKRVTAAIAELSRG